MTSGVHPGQDLKNVKFPLTQEQVQNVFCVYWVLDGMEYAALRKSHAYTTHTHAHLQVERNQQVDHYINGWDLRFSNWMRFVNGTTAAQANLDTLQFKNNIYYVTNQPVAAGTELTVYCGEAWNFKLGITPQGSHFAQGASRSSRLCSGLRPDKCSC